MSDLLKGKVIDLQELSIENSLNQCVTEGVMQKKGSGRKAKYKLTSSGMAQAESLMASRGVTPEMAKKMSLPNFMKAVFGDN